MGIRTDARPELADHRHLGLMGPSALSSILTMQCPSCKKNFNAEAAHLAQADPAILLTLQEATALGVFVCSCGRGFGSPCAVRAHQADAGCLVMQPIRLPT